MYVKGNNRGKLDSHEVFFEKICERYVPEICYQLDAGTELGIDAVRVLSGRLRDEASIAAITPCLTPPVPDSNSSLLHAWQYHDFALRQGVLLPVEGMLDYLGVMPGQVSAFRWSALRTPQGDVVPDPLWAYLHGIGAGSPLRRLMYLSEDRIIGSALALDPATRWKLKYEPSAIAFTDYCETVPELLRQRRRWTNSAMVCRLWLAGRVGSILRHKTRPASEKIRQSLAVFLQMTVGVREFIAPAHLFALALLLAEMAAGASGAKTYLVVSMVLLSIADILISWKLISAGEESPRDLRKLIAPVGWTSAALFVLTLVVCLPVGAFLIAIIPSIVVFFCLAMVLPGRALPILARTHFAPLQYSLLSNSILGYALWHLHDSSWGTKGLVARTQHDLADTHLRRFRTKTLLAWVIVNGIALAAASSPGLLSSSLNPVIEIVCLLDLLVAGISLFWLLARRISRGVRASASQCHSDQTSKMGGRPPFWGKGRSRF